MSVTSKKEKIIENMEAYPAIDLNVKIHIPRSPEPWDGRKHKFKCSCCGQGFKTRENNFQKSNDVLFQSNDGFLPWCKSCTDAYVNQMIAMYCNNEELAMKDFCQRAGWNYDVNALVASYETYSGHRSRSRISHYAAKKNINCDGRKTWIDSLRYKQVQKDHEIITTKEQIKEDDVSIKGTSIDRWGLGFTELDYRLMDEHYKLLKKQNPNCDANQEIFIKSLCSLSMLQAKALQDGDSDKYVKLTEQYSKTFTKAGLKTVQEVDNSADECLGVTLATIAQYTPEEYYKDKDLYKDFCKLGEYFDRFVKRPLKNLMTGSTDRDEEYYVKDGSGELDD